ncbi:hypothetical protein BEN47_07560 [Hymenobacter lapidarius]|uniref:MFS transporter n=1 Tax=Hymenobacter lapidarius TaxID=1908237 RepID=A0A1G1TEE1_9BACT|nr:hypothetical protein [Hymenobacter lapidarius]OGX89246.1 hypothetical protein BEN47_07560 [Hymenobacter lapidarius]
MTDADFHRAIRRIRWVHWLHYPLQTLLMGGAVLLAGQRAAVGPTLEPRLATWPVLLLLGGVVPLLGVLAYLIFRRLRPNIRRPAEENLRIYLGRMFLRNSLLSLTALPLLASYAITHQVFDLVACVGVLVALGWQLTPSAKSYQQWLLR